MIVNTQILVLLIRSLSAPAQEDHSVMKTESCSRVSSTAAVTGTSHHHSTAAEPWASLCSSQALCRIQLRLCLDIQQINAHRIRALDFNFEQKPAALN